MRIALFAVLVLSALPVDAMVYFQQTQIGNGGQLDFNGAFLDATPYPSSILLRDYRVTIKGGAIDEISWTFDHEQQSLWWERFDAGDPFINNGNEYNSPKPCDTPEGEQCDSGGYGSVTLAHDVGLVRQTNSPAGFNNCAAVLPGLIASGFIGVSQDCAETYIARHTFDIFATGTGPVTVTIADYDSSTTPEPAAWVMMIAGFGLVGTALRRVTGRRAAL